MKKTLLLAVLFTLNLVCFAQEKNVWSLKVYQPVSLDFDGLSNWIHPPRLGVEWKHKKFSQELAVGIASRPWYPYSHPMLKTNIKEKKRPSFTYQSSYQVWKSKNGDWSFKPGICLTLDHFYTRVELYSSSGLFSMYHTNSYNLYMGIMAELDYQLNAHWSLVVSPFYPVYLQQFGDTDHDFGYDYKYGYPARGEWLYASLVIRPGVSYTF